LHAGIDVPKGLFRHRATLLSLGLAATVLMAWLAWLGAMRTGENHARAALDSQLQVLKRSVESEIERFRYLPAVIARDGRIRAALADGSPDRLAAADRYLLAIRNDSGADALYVMKPDGLTMAASNYALPSSFVGENYRFRPYFRDALAKGSGRYYAVGVTTGLPGYFLASVIRDGDRVIGVAVAKVDMSAVEQGWRQSGTLAAITDGDGVVFLAGLPGWKYRPLHPLGQAALARIAAARKYDGVDLAASKPIFADEEPRGDGTAVVGLGGRHLLRSVRIEPDGWRLWAAASLAPIRATANLTALLAMLAGLLVSGAGLYWGQRRHLIRAKLEAHDRLEQRVAERTAELNREVEERRRAEMQLRDTQATLIHTAKLAALGRMSAAIAHEVSQPLAAMENTLASTGLLAARGEHERIIAKVATAREIVRRIQRTVKHLKSFARNEPGRREPVRVERCVAAAAELAAHRATAAGATITVAPIDPDIHAMAESTRLEQVILNLLVNALDAVGGRADPSVVVEATVEDGRVLIAVSDNGAGVPEALRERIAEPFFTTKETGEGLGLGLAISRAIVAEYGGALDFGPRDGGGPRFTVMLPGATAEPLPEAAE
jgi:two-component system C4-dicarboxylate transport sensor histidine kinase DctB